MARAQVLCCNKSVLGLLRFNRVASLMPRVHFMQIRRKCEQKGVVIGLYLKDGEKAPQLTPNGEKFDDRVAGKITELIKETNMDGELGKGRMFNNLDKEYSSVVVVGLGKEGIGYDAEEAIDAGMENTRVAAAVGTRSLQLQGASHVAVDGMEYPEQAAEGAAMAVWRYNANMRKSRRIEVPKVELYGSADVDAWTRGLFKAESQNLARRLSETPANQMTPSTFAQATIDSLCPCGVTVEVRSMDWIEEQRLNSFLMVAKGSCEPPLVLEINYTGSSPDDKPLLFIGKGLTFNSGGLSLKPKNGMDVFRADVSGAAAVVATVRAAAALSLPINVTAVLPLCENMPSGMAVKPGDVITLINGKTVCIKSVSSAGAVMLADPMLYAQNIHKPKMIVDLGTHAKGVAYGLGASATGLWTNNTMLWQQFEKAGSITGDRVWRFPLWQHFKRLVEPNLTYDICNVGRGPASSCLTAALLHKMVPCLDWVHLDTRGTGLTVEDGVPPYLLRDRMSGRPTRTLIQFLHQMACK
ncbi:PREDICTED: cytosol aminopeptidase [Drosophila arizonae]|uniref:Cytosol aminopeptidase n=1 Tax=Drosophila arizonae TaxID=7263 RepID=A0ABM1PNV5_DROAR|nr:PREDICTED: cytosol aminopeptidase [Drosophila arizonae]